MLKYAIAFGWLLLVQFSVRAENYGSFNAPVQVEFNKDGRHVTLLRELRYTDPRNEVWLAPKGWIVDGASIPQVAWSFIGGPFEGRYRDASVIHDVACDEKKQRWQDVHLTFYTAMLASGVDRVKAKIMYAAVYHFGPRWTRSQDLKLATEIIAREERELRVATNALESKKNLNERRTAIMAIPLDEDRHIVAQHKRMLESAHERYRRLLADSTPRAPSDGDEAAFKELAKAITENEGTSTEWSLAQIREREIH